MLSVWNNTQIKNARKDSGLSVKDAATKLNKTPEYISMLENGHRNPSNKLIQVMSSVYEKPVSFFLNSEKNLSLS